MAEYIMKKRNVPDGKKIICSVIAEEGILHLKQCQRSIREAAITVAVFCKASITNRKISVCILWEKEDKR